MYLDNATVVVDAKGLVRTYTIGQTRVYALRGVNLQVKTGEFVAVKGRSGSGKTTLLNILGGLDQPDSGCVLLDGKDLTTLKETEMVALRRKQVSFVFQSFGLLPHFSAYETVEFALRLTGLPRDERHERTLECLELVGLEQRQNHRPDELSGGQQQRLCIARAIANHPALILADEPTGELDSRTGRDILSLFRQIAALEGTAMVLATHDPIVLEFASTMYELDDGILNDIGK
jgi:putative ABC transport system ATP-binding protein